MKRNDRKEEKEKERVGKKVTSGSGRQKQI